MIHTNTNTKSPPPRHPNYYLRSLARGAGVWCWLSLPLAAQATAGPAPPLGGFPEGCGTIQDVLVHFDPGMSYELFPTLRDLVAALDPSVTFHTAVGDREDVDAARFFMLNTGLGSERLRCVVSGTELTIWARDRLVVIGGGSGSRLLSPPSGMVNPDRSGDLRVPPALAQVLPAASAEIVPMSFEGGNLLFTRQRLLVGRNLLQAEMQRSGHGEQEVLACLRSAFGREPIVLGVDAAMPHDHLDMYLTVIDDHTVLLADPRRGAEFVKEVTKLGLDAALLPGANRWTAQAQLRLRSIYDAIAGQLRHHGFTVHRLPVVHGDETVMLTWNNALLESRDGQRRAYVPQYGLPHLDAEALGAYRQLGCRVWPIDVSRIAIHGGTVRCVTNVLQWTVAESSPAAR